MEWDPSRHQDIHADDGALIDITDGAGCRQDRNLVRLDLDDAHGRDAFAIAGGQ